ncbi:MFS transporter [Nocardia puris]|uniref:MFS transporter n=1 Tax=Nocardia puris TaxID=208602 RepID=A0A366E4Q0_9NOCA|nr:MFS transporter [Nocardia puris]RBO96368.1 MFS transporter [Nocardia puris]
MRRVRGEIAAVAAAYGVQGMGYAVAVTSLPEFKSRLGVDEMTLSLIVLGACLTAALGSMLADAVAVRRGSRKALCAGLVVEAVALLGVLTAGDLAVFAAGFAVYGVGLGAVDAAANMQGVLAQRREGVPLLGRMYAAYTAAARVNSFNYGGAVSLGMVASGPSLGYAFAIPALILVAAAPVLRRVRADAGIRTAPAVPETAWSHPLWPTPPWHTGLDGALVNPAVASVFPDTVAATV